MIALAELAILIPCRNEESSLIKLVEDLRSEHPEAQIILIDNGSVDSTYEKATQLEGIVVVQEPRRGKSLALRRGMNLLTEKIRYIAIIDGDLTYSAADLKKCFLQLVEHHRLQMVVGNRLWQRQGFKWSNFLFNKLVIQLVNLKSERRVEDLLSGLRVWRKESFKVEHLKSQGFEFETEQTLSYLKGNKMIGYCPISYNNRPGGFSKLRPLRDALSILKLIFFNYLF